MTLRAQTCCTGSKQQQKGAHPTAGRRDVAPDDQSTAAARFCAGFLHDHRIHGPRHANAMEFRLSGTTESTAASIGLSLPRRPRRELLRYHRSRSDGRVASFHAADSRPAKCRAGMWSGGGELGAQSDGERA